MPDEMPHPTSFQETHCPQCGGTIATSEAVCPYCGAWLGEGSIANVHDDWPAPPDSLAQIGYILLILLGGATLLGGVAFFVISVILGSTIFDLSLSIALLVVGSMIFVYSLRALDARHWHTVAVGRAWAWLVLIIVVWGAGTGVTQALPGAEGWVLPPLIVIGSAATSLLYLATALRGLRMPAGRGALQGRLLPQHRLLLSASLASFFSTGSALLLEAIALIGTMGVMVAASQIVGDQATLDLLRELIRDPQALDRLEEMLGRSPVALVGLGAILVFIAPAIEEGTKALPLFLFARRRAQLSQRTAILIGVAGGVGFAFAENTGYLSALTAEWWLIFWFRVAAGVMHGTASGFVGRAWWQGLKRGRWYTMLRDLCIGWGIHAFWNGLALLAAWFAYREDVAGVLFVVGIGLVPLAVLFALLARWGIWVEDEELQGAHHVAA
jgi:RsiW-degrading membrane proteinase PrsW (M82 family)